MRCGDELWAAVWNAGIRVIDVSDLTKPRTIGAYDYHPAIPEPTHTVMPFERPIGGRHIAAAIDEEHEHLEGRLHGFRWIFDAADLSRIEPLSIITLGHLPSPFSVSPDRCEEDWSRLGTGGVVPGRVMGSPCH